MLTRTTKYLTDLSLLGTPLSNLGWSTIHKRQSLCHHQQLMKTGPQPLKPRVLLFLLHQISYGPPGHHEPVIILTDAIYSDSNFQIPLPTRRPRQRPALHLFSRPAPRDSNGAADGLVTPHSPLRSSSRSYGKPRNSNHPHSLTGGPTNPNRPRTPA